MDTKYFPMFHSYLDTLAGLTDAQFGHVIRAALKYSKDGEVPDLDAIEAMAFGFIKMDVDRAREKYEAIAERNRINGSKGGRPKNPENPVGILGTQNNPEEPKKPIEREKEKAKEKENEKGSIVAATAADTAPKRRTKFSPPTVDEVAAYCAENGFGTIDPEAFVDYYEARGWKIGSQSMKDWRATVRNWARRDAEKQTQAAELDRDPMLAFLDKVIAGEA